MNNETFNSVVDNRIAQIKTVLQSKGKEYSSDIDRLHNFRIAAKLSSNQETPEQALWGMLRKHLVSVIDIIGDTGKGIFPNKAKRDEKVGDAINYLILLEALLIDNSTTMDEPVKKTIAGTCGSLNYK